MTTSRKKKTAKKEATPRPTLKIPYKAGFTWKGIRYTPARMSREELEALRHEIPGIFN